MLQKGCKPSFAIPPEKGDGVAFGNTYVESPLGHFGHEDVHRTAGRHGGSYTYDPWIGFRQFHQCISENVLEQGRHSFRIGYETLSGDGIELAGSVPFGGVFLGRAKPFPLIVWRCSILGPLRSLMSRNTLERFFMSWPSIGPK